MNRVEAPAAPDLLPRRRDEARALFRNAILDAAEAIFAERGYHGARIQDIAARARIAVGTVYNHFAQKDDVLVALLEQRSEELLTQLDASPDDPPAFRGRLEAGVTRLLTHVERHRAFFAIANEHGLFAGSAAPGARAKSPQHVERFRAVFRGLVEEGIAAGDLEPIGAEALARFLGGTLRAFLLCSLVEQQTDARALATMIVELFLHGASRGGRAALGSAAAPRSRRRGRSRSRAM